MDIIDHDLKKQFDYSSLLDSLNPNPNEEDVASWADSCLSKDVGPSDFDLSCIKDSLMEILTSPPESGKQHTHNRKIISTENVSIGFDRRFDQDEDLMDDDDDIIVGDSESIEFCKDNEGYVPFGIKSGATRRRSFCDNVFRPNYTKEIGEAEHLSFGMDLNLTAYYYEAEPLSEDIFKVWDLGISDELDDDFTKEFSKHLIDVPEEIQFISTDHDSTSSNDSMDVSVDHLTAGVDRLSLIQRT